MEGREVTKPPLERIADALEKLIEQPEIELEFGPPICASCGKFNPVIRIDAQDAQEGPMLEIVTVATCTHCNERLYVVHESFSVHCTLDTVRQEIEQRRAGFSNVNV